MEKCRVALLGLGGAIVVGAGLILIILRKSKKKQQETATEPKPQNAAAKWVELSLLRRCRIDVAGPTDHTGDMVLVERAGFDLGATIFASVSSPLSRQVLYAKLRLEPFWREAAVSAMTLRSLSSPRAPPPRFDAEVLAFMNERCNFAMEHADGSFMEHLQFCYEYCASHFAGESPRVLLLHSALGVGTNYFPCTVDQIEPLRNMLTPREFAHVEAFPSVLRLLLHRRLLDDLERRTDAQLKALQGLELFRVIDNQPLALDATQLWAMLNYQLIHLLDFLPAADWKAALDRDLFFVSFARLHALLARAGQLRCTVDFQLKQQLATADAKRTAIACEKHQLARPCLGEFLINYVPSKIQATMGERQIAVFSAAIGHSLDYTLK